MLSYPATPCYATPSNLYSVSARDAMLRNPEKGINNQTLCPLFNHSSPLCLMYTGMPYSTTAAALRYRNLHASLDRPTASASDTLFIT